MTLAYPYWSTLQSIDVPAVVFNYFFCLDPTGVNQGLVPPKVRAMHLHGHDDPDRCVWQNVWLERVTSLDVVLERIDFPFLIAALTHLKAEQGNASQLVAHGAFAHLTHVDLPNDTYGIMVQTLPMTVRSVKANFMHPQLNECLSRILGLEFVDVEPRPAPLDLLHLEYHAGSALWPALLDMGWFRNWPAKALRMDVMIVGPDANRTSYLLFTLRTDIIFMPGADDSARPMLTAALVEFTMLVDERMSGNVRSAGADTDQVDDI
ncbi:hypothetical protein GGF31_006782 [Allomyces arbusculus]|nr:hypothetical protein GGF31_006782 [Allomyces arbusculus]